MIIAGSDWKVAERPGYFGRHRQTRQRQFDCRFGPGNWRLGWQLGGVFLEMAEAVMLYEDAYWHFLSSRPQVFSELRSACADVYDDSVSNVDSGFDYLRQETERTHLQDIAIRRCMLRCGSWFEGEGLLRIRDSEGEHRLSLTLSPGRVPFHRPDWIVTPELEGWWRPGSVESFYQSNKVLLTRSVEV